MLVRVEGIVIRSMDYGEGNKIITVLTKPFGKTSIMVKGARKMKSRFGALAQLLTLGEFIYYQSKPGSMGSLNHGEIEESHSRLREHLTLAAYAAYIAELTDKLVHDDEPAPLLYEQLKAALQGLEDNKDPEIVTALYEWKAVTAAGYEPLIDQCCQCGATAAEGLGFSAAAGGHVCRSHAGSYRDTIPLTAASYKLLAALIHLDARRLGSINVSPESKADLKKVGRLWFDTHVGVRLKSRDFLDAMADYL